MARNVRCEGGNESGSAWTDVARGQPNGSDNTSASLSQQQYRYLTDIDQSGASTSRTITGTLADGTHAQPAPRTWDDISRQQRTGGGNTATKGRRQGGSISDGNWVARTRGEGVENNGFEQRSRTGGQEDAGMEDLTLPKPLDGQTSSQTALDGGTRNRRSTFDAEEGGKVKNALNFSGADERIAIKSVSAQIGTQLGMERGHPMWSP